LSFYDGINFFSRAYFLIRSCKRIWQGSRVVSRAIYFGHRLACAVFYRFASLYTYSTTTTLSIYILFITIQLPAVVGGWVRGKNLIKTMSHFVFKCVNKTLKFSVICIRVCFYCFYCPDRSRRNKSIYGNIFTVGARFRVNISRENCIGYTRDTHKSCGECQTKSLRVSHQTPVCLRHTGCPYNLY